MPTPEDERLFGAEALIALRLAAEEAAWLIGRGYDPGATLDLVAGRHALAPRQRIAVERGISPDASYKRRVARELEPEDIARRPLRIDGDGLLGTVEAALSGGLLLKSIEGNVRGLDWTRGSHAPSSITDTALDRIGEAIAPLRPKLVRWYFDQGAGGSAGLRDRVLERSKRAKHEVEVRLVPSVEAALGTAAHVCSSEPAILDGCASWFNLAGRIVERIPEAWMLALA